MNDLSELREIAKEARQSRHKEEIPEIIKVVEEALEDAAQEGVFRVVVEVDMDPEVYNTLYEHFEALGCKVGAEDGDYLTAYKGIRVSF